MRFALITSQAFSLTNFRGPLIAALVSRGIEVLAIAPDFNDVTRASVQSLGATPVDCVMSRAGMNPVRDLLLVWRLASQLRRLKVDVCLAYFIKPVIFGNLAAVLARVPSRFCMIEGLGYVFTPPSGREPLRRKFLRAVVSRLYRFSLWYADRVFLLNDDDIGDMVNRGLVRSSQVVKLNGIGVDLFHWAPAPAVTSPITFLLAARLLREKGIVEYAGAARIVKKQFPDTRFILLGAVDPNPGSLSAHEVTEWVKEGLLEWPGHVDIQPWLSQTSVYVLPSYYREGVPRSTQEAMAMGRPVITTDAPGCRETVVKGENGFLVPVRDVAALADAMMRFIAQPELIEVMGGASRALAVERFDVHKVNEVMLAAMGIAVQRLRTETFP
jgi:glycosyltransferase involved in cell wall biosynthesis